MHPQPTQPATIRAADLALVLAAAKLRLYTGGRTCSLSALTPAPLLEIDCHFRAPSQSWRDQVLRAGRTTGARVGPMRRGHIAHVYERTRTCHGLPEVYRIWGTGIRALRAEPRHVLNGAPQWPFGKLTPPQQRRHAAQLEAMRAGRLARYPAHLPAAATTTGAAS